MSQLATFTPMFDETSRHRKADALRAASDNRNLIFHQTRLRMTSGDRRISKICNPYTNRPCILYRRIIA